MLGKVIELTINCPYRGFTRDAGEFKSIKSPEIQFRTATILDCLKFDGLFNFHKDLLSGEKYLSPLPLSSNLQVVMSNSMGG